MLYDLVSQAFAQIETHTHTQTAKQVDLTVLFCISSCNALDTMFISNQSIKAVIAKNCVNVVRLIQFNDR